MVIKHIPLSPGRDEQILAGGEISFITMDVSQAADSPLQSSPDALSQEQECAVKKQVSQGKRASFEPSPWVGRPQPD